MFQLFNATVVIHNVHIHQVVDATDLASKQDLVDLKGQIMSLISDAIADVKAAADAEQIEITAKYDALNARITALEGTVATGLATPEDFAALSALKLQIGNFAPTVTPVPPVEPPPPVLPVEPPPVVTPVEPPVVPPADQPPA